MSSTITPEVLAMLTDMAHTAIYSGYVVAATQAAFIWHWLTTLEEEVEMIWSRQIRAGNVLFIITRYAVIVRIFIDVFGWFPTGVRPSAMACHQLTIALQIFAFIHTWSATASVLLCLHALFGANKRILLALFAGYGVFAVTTAVILAHFVSGLRFEPAAFPTLIPCNYYSPNGTTYLMLAGYVATAREGILFLIGSAVLYTRYRDHDNSLIKVIRRDGGIYYAVVLTLGLASAIVLTPGVPAKDRYNVASRLRIVAYPILANRLLLNLKSVKEPWMRTAASVILFASTDDDEELSKDSAYSQADVGAREMPSLQYDEEKGTSSNGTTAVSTDSTAASQVERQDS